MKIYCDTNTLPYNIRHTDEKSRRELHAVEQLAQKHVLVTSRGVLRELMNTRSTSDRKRLKDDYDRLEMVLKDENVLSFQAQVDHYGGMVAYPLVSDVWNQAIRNELVERGLSDPDAQHITQAVCNDCRVFLTRDEDTIIDPHRAWLEERFPGFRVRLPSELLEEESVDPDGDAR